ncbi:tyrosine-protein phosphatase [Butyrivibrio sp. FC2001]|uniref:tyrosine-protein phosphatase n=1 Tax=Butyrivibrio sp. FC2001 TaxID=1280671 RepID=UPI0003FEC4E5|nr:tyrosine-protein phosphatase [Butyrivibrio sp. FC2001]
MNKKYLSFFMAFLIATTLFVPTKITTLAEETEKTETAKADTSEVAELSATAELDKIQKYGNVVLSMECKEILDAGYEYGDVVNVSFLDQTMELPFCSNFSDVDSGVPVILAREEDTNVVVAINMGDFATTYGLAIKETAEDKTVTWTAADGVEFPITFTISMNTPKGYYDEYQLRQMSYTTERSDYPDLTDEQFANFRAVTTTGMGEGKLYRSASPINTRYNRNSYADAAIKKAGVTVIMNMADDEATAKSFEGYDDTYYSKQKVIFLNMGLDLKAQDFKDKLAQGLKFFAKNPGVYEIHCTEGKDRAGYACALLECFMGASYDEVVEDYATTYYNYYGIKKGDEKYTFIVNNVTKNLENAFGITDVKNADLAAEADKFFTAIGLTDAEKDALRANLGTEDSSAAEEVTEATEETEKADESEASEKTDETEAKEEATEETEKADESPAATYIVQPGDYLIKIAKEQLGDANKWTEIYKLNKDIIKDPSLIYVGQELKLK